MAAGAAGIAAGNLLSDSASATPSRTTQVSASSIPTSWDDEADVVVLGYGGSGIVAAIEAADGGARPRPGSIFPPIFPFVNLGEWGGGS